MSSSPSEQPPPRTLADEDAVRCLPEHGFCWVNSLEQVSEQVGHDEHVKDAIWCCIHIVGPAMNASIVNIHTHAGAHRRLSRSAIEAMRAAN